MPIGTAGTVLKRFQQDAVSNAFLILETCLRDLAQVRGTENYASSRNLIVGDLGTVLIEAPTGTGKTLMAGHTIERLSQLHTHDTSLPPVLWFWFAPFTGLIDQSVQTIRDEFGGLQPRRVLPERDPETLRTGDVFITTWASVAASNELSRRARIRTEEMPSLDELVVLARAQGFVIGVVIDEAHHTFREQNQAFAFYRNVLSPELTILTTATPKDRDLETFCQAVGIKDVRRITISRQDAVDARLIKRGVKVAVFKAPQDVEAVIDFKRTAIEQAVVTHRVIKRTLSDIGVGIVPLLLVQVESGDESVAQAAAYLQELGFKKNGASEVLRVHTASEPDPHLTAIAADETVEVLIFKMAVALGFDAPRAFTLVSLKPSRDQDFGVQIVGRIMRVDRRLQAWRELPILLNYGYVFLSDMAGQAGLSSAAKRINAVKTELASVTPNVAVVAVGGDTIVQAISDRQTLLFAPTISPTERPTDDQIVEEQIVSQPSDMQDALWKDWGLTDDDGNLAKEPGHVPAGSDALYRYNINASLHVQHAFKKALLSLDGADVLRDVVNRFRFDEATLLVAQQSAAQIIQEEIEIFAGRKGKPQQVRAALAQKQIDRRAQLTLFKADPYDVIDIKELHTALLSAFSNEVQRRGLSGFDTEEALRAGLHKILALRPKQLRRAVSEAVVQHTIVEDAAPLPESLRSDMELVPARLNVYGVFPSDLNSWERPFAEYLDDDLTGTILWWHRNPVRKPYSVSLPLPGQPNFYPDFVVGIADRKRANGVLLVETKRDINDQLGNAIEKSQAAHPYYGKVMMVYWHDKREWRVVEYDADADKNILDQLLRPEVMKSY